MKIKNDKFHSVKSLAKLLGVHENTIRAAIKCGRLKAFRIGRGPRAAYRINENEIERMQEYDMFEVIKKIK